MFLFYTALSFQFIAIAMLAVASAVFAAKEGNYRLNYWTLSFAILLFAPLAGVAAAQNFGSWSISLSYLVVALLHAGLLACGIKAFWRIEWSFRPFLILFCGVGLSLWFIGRYGLEDRTFAFWVANGAFSAMIAPVSFAAAWTLFGNKKVHSLGRNLMASAFVAKGLIEFGFPFLWMEPDWIAASILMHGIAMAMAAAGSLIISVDRTAEALRLIKESAQRASTSKSTFVANVTHQLRTPLNRILGFAQMIHGQTVGAIQSRKYVEYADDIRSSGEELLGMVNNIIDKAKVESGQQTLVEEVIPLPKFIASIIRSVVAEAASAKLTLSYHVAPQIEELYADPRLIKQVLMNLLSNAIKYTPAGGKISLLIYSQNGECRIALTDTGPGMTPAVIEEIFHPFAAVSLNQLYKKVSGAGFGLPLAKSLVELHGGRLQIDSQPGQGTTFLIRLPNDRLALAGQKEHQKTSRRLASIPAVFPAASPAFAAKNLASPASPGARPAGAEFELAAS